MTERKPDWIEKAMAHGSGLRDQTKVSFDREQRPLKVTHELEDNISICKADGTLLAKFAFGRDIHYPYWAPVCTPSGAQISLFSPHDHNWHRGLWMVWKYVNGVNFWEGPFSGESVYGMELVEGIDHLSMRDNRVEARFPIAWVTNDGQSFLKEVRSFTFTYPSKDALYYFIDITSELTAIERDAVIGSADIRQYEWGGYGGMGFRASRDLCGLPDRLIVSSGGVISREVHGARGDWAAYSGLRDGSFGATWAGFALIDHRDNPVHPVPFHASADTICYVGTAPARYESFTIQKDTTRVFRNRFVCFDGETDTALIQRLFEEFV